MKVERRYILGNDKAELAAKCEISKTSAGNKRYCDIHIELKAEHFDEEQKILIDQAMDNFSRNAVLMLDDGIEVGQGSISDELRIIRDEEGNRTLYLGNKKVRFVKSFKIKSVQGGKLALLTLKTVVRFRGAPAEIQEVQQ